MTQLRKRMLEELQSRNKTGVANVNAGTLRRYASKAAERDRSFRVQNAANRPVQTACS